MARSTPKQKSDLMRGTLDLMILRTLELEPLHGVAIADRIGQTTGGTFEVLPGSLFPALHRLERQGWISGRWTTNAVARRVRSYRLTPAGRKRLSVEKRSWQRIASAVAQVLGTE